MKINDIDYKRVNVIQGEHAVSSNPGDCLTTILGSCVATCLYDPVAKLGGMNHFLLPGGGQAVSYGTNSYGLNAMEMLINGLLKKGAKRSRFEAKIFGGARIIEGLTNVGQKNGMFATEFLAFEGINCVSKSLGGTMARRIRFWPTTGRVQMKFLAPETLPLPVTKPPATSVAVNELELF